MTTQQQLNYGRIAEAITFIQLIYRQQPCLEKVAVQLQLSPFHFQWLFTDWAGVSPKKFLQYISISYAKNMLKQKKASLFETACETGLSGTGRLHDLFIKIEGMTPGEFKNGGKGLSINYSFESSPFGTILIASTTIGICYMAFTEGIRNDIADLKQLYPNANFKQCTDFIQQNALQFFVKDLSGLTP